jgi:hypothetical protein
VIEKKKKAQQEEKEAGTNARERTTDLLKLWHMENKTCKITSAKSRQRRKGNIY